MFPQPHHGIFGLIEGEPSLGGQPFGKVLCDQRRRFGIHGDFNPVICFVLPFNNPACSIAPNQSVRWIASDQLTVCHKVTVQPGG